MPRMTQAEYAAYQLKRRVGRDVGQATWPGTPSRDDKREQDLHNQIITEHLKPMRWPYIHSRMDRPPTIRVGWPDFTIFPPTRVVIVEIKIGTRKLDPHQMEVKCELETQGYIYNVARTFEEYLEIVNARRL